MNLRLSRRSVLLFSLIETAVIAAATIYMVSIWYPDPYFSLFGVGFRLSGILAVLILLGPVIGFVFYKPNHELYVNDLSVIYIVKLSTLFLALHLAYSQRPLLAVFSVDRFVVVQGHQIPMQHMPPDIVKMMLLSEDLPLIAARKLPDGNFGPLLEVMSGGVDIEYRPAQYERFEYQIERFYQRFCRSELGDGDEKTDYDQGCGLVNVPLVYKGDHYATAVFESKDYKIKNVVLSDPW